jgi:hypothetical protein
LPLGGPPGQREVELLQAESTDRDGQVRLELAAEARLWAEANGAESLRSRAVCVRRGGGAEIELTFVLRKAAEVSFAWCRSEPRPRFVWVRALDSDTDEGAKLWSGPASLVITLPPDRYAARFFDRDGMQVFAQEFSVASKPCLVRVVE